MSLGNTGQPYDLLGGTGATATMNGSPVATSPGTVLGLNSQQWQGIGQGFQKTGQSLSQPQQTPQVASSSMNLPQTPIDSGQQNLGGLIPSGGEGIQTLISALQRLGLQV